MVRQISRDELLRMMDSKVAFKLVDVLPRESFENEHIKGALSIPLNDIELKAAGLLKKTETIVTYCGSFDCSASTKAAEKLLLMGYQAVLDYKGGLKDYKEANLALEGKLHEVDQDVCAECMMC
ncbi:MAG: rhodanese-like domain-containing protein [Candidatus Omnitrophota bacterium]